MAFRNGRRRGGSVRGGRSMPVHRSAAETLDGFFPPRLDRCLKRECSNEKESGPIPFAVCKWAGRSLPCTRAEGHLELESGGWGLTVVVFSVNRPEKR